MTTHQTHIPERMPTEARDHIDRLEVQLLRAQERCIEYEKQRDTARAELAVLRQTIRNAADAV